MNGVALQWQTFNILLHYQPQMHPLNCQQRMSIDIIVTILLVVCFIFSSWHRSRLTLPVKTVKRVMFCTFLCNFWLICQPHSAALTQKLKAASLFASNQLSRTLLLVSSTVAALGLTKHYKISQTACAPLCCFLNSLKRIRTCRAKDFPNCYVALKN